MNWSASMIARMMGIILAGFIFIHYQGMPYGLMSTVATALFFLPI